MTLSHEFLRSSLLFLTAGLFGVAVGCTVGSGDLGGPHDCGGVGSHSEINEETDECECDPGYVWCNPEDPEDYECCSEDVYCPDPNSHAFAGECVCDDGYEWCYPDDPDDLSCCEADDGGTGTDDGGTGTDDGGTDDGSTGDGGDDCPPGDPPPDDPPCTDGDMWCTSADANCPGDYYVCEGGEWALDEETGTLWCTDEGYDFQHGCYDDLEEEVIYFLCDYGPGTPCDGTEVVCADSDTIEECKHGKLTQDSCLRICQEEGDAGGASYDWGECGEQDGSIECLCCDYDEPGCGDGGTGTGTDTGTGS
jgi:hypothetical protein